MAEKRIKVIANACGVNLSACREALAKVAAEAGVSLKIGTVEGDDLLARADELRALPVKEWRTGAPLPERPASINAYLGAFPIAAALDAGADIVVTGRCVDSALVLGPLIHEFSWGAEDYDKLAAGSLCGHLLECGAQATGGNFTDWRDTVSGWAEMGFPIAEVSEGGEFVITKVAGTGGAVTPLTVAEQLVYEIGDPAAYLLPDVSCDFTDVRLEAVGADRVGVSGAKGRPAPEKLKVSATYAEGASCRAALALVGIDAQAKARAMGEAVAAKASAMAMAVGLGDFDAVRIEVFGDTRDGGGNEPVVREVMLRLGVQHRRKEGAELFAREFAGAGLSMSPGITFVTPGRPGVSATVRLYSFLLERRSVQPKVAVDGSEVPFSSAHPRESGDPGVFVSEPHSAPGEKTWIPAFAGMSGRGVAFIELAVARSGDKGDDANIGVIARRAEYLAPIRDALTPDLLAQMFGATSVERYELPGISALNFVLRDCLGGGGAGSLHLDAQAKTFAQRLLAVRIPLPKT